MRELSIAEINEVSGGDGIVAGAFTVGGAVATAAVVGSGIAITAPVVVGAAVVYSVGFAIGYVSSQFFG